MRNDNSDFQTGFVSRAGSLAKNRNYFAFTELDDLACWVIADGLDSDQEVKSAEMAVKSILESFMEKPSMAGSRLKKYISEAHKLLTAESRRVRLKASLLLVVTDYTRMIWAVAGNSRLYHFRNGRLNLKSRDQSLSQAMADAEKIPEDRLEQHEERHNLLTYLGKPGSIKPYISQKYKLNDGDVVLLCTPGLWESVDSAEMLDAAEGAKEPAELVDTLEEVLLSKQKKVLNNYTIAAIFANKVFKEDPKKRMKYVKVAAAVLIPAIIIGAGAFVLKARAAAQKAEAVAGMLEHGKHGDEFMQDGDYDKAQKEYSEAAAASAKLKDLPGKEKFGKKGRLAQLIVDGDGSFKSGDYLKAEKSYKKAKEEAAAQQDFDPKDLDGRIDKTQSFLDIQELIKQGDLKFQGGDCEGAKGTYQKAMLLATEASFKDAQKDLKPKLAELEIKMAGDEKQKNQLAADIMEKKGDDSVASQAFEQAMTFYSQAKDAYQAAGVADKALVIEKKMLGVEEKLKPAPGDSPTSVSASLQGETDSKDKNNTKAADTGKGTNG